MLKELFDTKRQYLNHFFDHLDILSTEKILKACLECRGRIFLTGVGKSGLVAQKIASTMASTGTQAFFLSPANALHGDIGIVDDKDLCLMFSKSGESEELLNMVPYLKRKGASLIAVVSTPSSRLGHMCQLSVHLPLEKEICPFDKVPTTSAVIQMIFGDILSVALMRHKEFDLSQYALNHPAGRIGRRMTLMVKDLMLTGNDIPTCKPEAKIVDVLFELSNQLCCAVIIKSDQDIILGIFTDGDLRRALQTHGGTVLESPIERVMVKTPKTIGPDALALDAMRIMEANHKREFMVLPVIDEQRKVLGIIKMHDIIQSGL